MKKLATWVLVVLLGCGLSPLAVSVDEHDDHQSQNDNHEDNHNKDEHGDEDNHAEQGHDEHGGEEAGLTLTIQQLAAAGIVSEVLQARRVATQVRAPGEVQLNAYKTVKATPRIAAQIIKRHVILGDAVKVGQLLVTLSSVDMAQAQGELLVTERNWRRVKKLGREVVSEQRYTEAHITRAQARARAQAYGMTKQQVNKLVASGDASLANGRFQLLATQDGTVIRDAFIVGELVDAGRVLFEISDESTLWVEARLMPEQAAQVQVGAAAIVEIRAEQVNGKVIQVHHALDEQTRTLGVRIEIPNPDDRLHPGLFVQARIDGAAAEQVLAVPTNAILRSPDGDWQLFVEHEPGQFEPREIAVIRSAGELTVIEGLEPGARVVTQGAFFLQSELAKSGFSIHNH